MRWTQNQNCYWKTLAIAVGLAATIALLALYIYELMVSFLEMPKAVTEKAAYRDVGLAEKLLVENNVQMEDLRSIKLLEISEKKALALNLKRPNYVGHFPSATAFKLPNESGQYANAMTCLTYVIYYEAAGESLKGQSAVAQVVLNRVRSPLYPSTICGVVFQGMDRKTGCQFSFSCDGSMSRQPSESGWKEAEAIARLALRGSVNEDVGLATHYHANYVIPYWASSLTKLSTIGRHIFYGLPGVMHRRSAFDQPYGNTEIGVHIPSLLQDAATSVSPMDVNPQAKARSEELRRKVIFGSKLELESGKKTSEPVGQRWVILPPSE